MRILLVDDDEQLMEILAERLIQQRYAVDIAIDGQSAQSYVDLFNYDLIVLDLMLPDGDGISFCRTFRQQGYENPLMILTAKESVAEKVKALDAGADDYVVKPFDFDELCARIRALLRREHHGLPTVLEWGPLRLDPSTCETQYQGQVLRLTPKEFAMMELFLRHPHRVYSLGAIIDDLWSFEDPPGEDAIRTHVKGLRRKLKEAGAPKDLIKTVYGQGYRLNDQVVWSLASSSATQKKSPATTAAASKTKSPTPRPSEPIQQSLAQVCDRYFKSARAHVDNIEAAANALSEGHLTTQLADCAHRSAHKLAGSLGSYGIPEGSHIAKAIETWLADWLDAPENECPSSRDTQASAIQNNGAGDNDCHHLRQRASLVQLSSQLRHCLEAQTTRQTSQAIAANLEQTKPLLWIISSEPGLTLALDQAATRVDLRVQSLTTLSAASRQLQTLVDNHNCKDSRSAVAESSRLMVHPALIILDLPSTPDPEAIAFIKQTQALSAPAQQPTPVMILSPPLNLSYRLQLIQLGVQVFSSRTGMHTDIIHTAASIIRTPASSIRVAIADDDPQIHSLLNAGLKPWGFQLTNFYSAQSLWRWLATAADESKASMGKVPVDMVVLDINMPDMTGIELCKVLRADARFRHLPILFLTGYRNNALRMQAFEAGADDVIDKAIMGEPEDDDSLRLVSSHKSNYAQASSKLVSELATRLRNQITRTYRNSVLPQETLETIHLEAAQSESTLSSADSSPNPAQTLSESLEYRLDSNHREKQQLSGGDSLHR